MQKQQLGMLLLLAPWAHKSCLITLVRIPLEYNSGKSAGQYIVSMSCPTHDLRRIKTFSFEQMLNLKHHYGSKPHAELKQSHLDYRRKQVELVDQCTGGGLFWRQCQLNVTLELRSNCMFTSHHLSELVNICQIILND